MKYVALILIPLMTLFSCAEEKVEDATLSPESLPPMRWNEVQGSDAWNEAALKALGEHGLPLLDVIPNDISDWCPTYGKSDAAGRSAFWIGFMSALAKHESTFRPTAVSSNGKWFGLLQISPATARGYGCRATSGSALKDGGENLSCAIRIMAVTVPRDRVVANNDGRWRGVAADWGPLRVASKRNDMSKWLKAQPYCQ